MRFIYLAFIVPASVCIPLLAGSWRYRRLPGYARIVLAYLAIAGIVNVLASVMAAKRVNNMPLLHIYTFIEFVLLALFYKAILEGKIKRVINWLIAVFALVCVAYASFAGNIYAHNIIPRSLESFIIGSLAIIFLFRQMNVPARHTETVHWINTGLLLYFSGSFLLFLFSEVLARDRAVNNIAWVMHATLVLLMYLLFAIAFIRTRKQ
jgi:hypothetical protein